MDGVEVAGTEEEILSSYEGVTWPAGLEFRQILRPAPLPSPFSPVLQEWLQNNPPGDLWVEIAELYDVVLLNRGQFWDTIGQRQHHFGGSGASRVGFACWGEFTMEMGLDFEDEVNKCMNGGWAEQPGLNALKVQVETLVLLFIC